LIAGSRSASFPSLQVENSIALFLGKTQMHPQLDVKKNKSTVIFFSFFKE
jgi:hypothetical protein